MHRLISCYAVLFSLLMFVALLFLFDLQNTTEPPAVVETLADVPEHVLRGLPEDVRLFPSAVDKTRLGECNNCKGNEGF